MDESEYRQLPLSGYVDITNVAVTSQMKAEDSLVMRPDDGEFKTGRITYADFTSQIYDDIKERLQDDINRIVIERVDTVVQPFEMDIESRIESLSSDARETLEKVLQNSTDILSMSDYIEQLIDDLKKVTADDDEVKTAVLKIANCQLSIRTELDNMYKNLSVVVL